MGRTKRLKNKSIFASPKTSDEDSNYSSTSDTSDTELEESDERTEDTEKEKNKKTKEISIINESSECEEEQNMKKELEKLRSQVSESLSEEKAEEASSISSHPTSSTEKLFEGITTATDTKTQCKEFFITFNNMNEDLFHKFENFIQNEEVLSCVMSREEAPTTGHVHFHCYILFRKRKWRRNLTKMFPGDYRKIITTPVQCYMYIIKDGDIVLEKNINWLKSLKDKYIDMGLAKPDLKIGGYWKNNEYVLIYKTKGQKSYSKTYNIKRSEDRKAAAKSFIQFVEQHTLGEIKEEYPCDYKNHLPMIKKIKEEFMKDIPFSEYEYSLKQKNYWLWGSAGTSKTSYGFDGLKKFTEDCSKDQVFMKTFNSKWWDGYDPKKHRVIIIDDINTNINQEQIGLLKLILDRNVTTAEIKGSSIILVPNNYIVICTSNHRIEDIFTNAEDQKAIERRCNVFHCVSPSDLINGIYKDGVVATTIPPPPHLFRLLDKKEILETSIFNNLTDPCWNDDDNQECLFKKYNYTLSTISKFNQNDDDLVSITNPNDKRLLNQYIKRSTNTILTIVNDDDIYDPEKEIKEQAQKLFNDFVEDNTVYERWNEDEKVIVEKYKPEIKKMIRLYKCDKCAKEAKAAKLKEEEEYKRSIEDDEKHKEVIIINEEESESEDYDDSIIDESSDNDESESEEELLENYFYSGKKMDIKCVNLLDMNEVMHSVEEYKINISKEQADKLYEYIRALFSFAVNIDQTSNLLIKFIPEFDLNYIDFIDEYKKSIVIDEEVRNYTLRLIEDVLSNEVLSFLSGKQIRIILKLIKKHNFDQVLLDSLCPKGLVKGFLDQVKEFIIRGDVNDEDLLNALKEAKRWDKKKKDKYIKITKKIKDEKHKEQKKKQNDEEIRE